MCAKTNSCFDRGVKEEQDRILSILEEATKKYSDDAQIWPNVLIHELIEKIKNGKEKL